MFLKRHDTDKFASQSLVCCLRYTSDSFETFTDLYDKALKFPPITGTPKKADVLTVFQSSSPILIL